MAAWMRGVGLALAVLAPWGCAPSETAETAETKEAGAAAAAPRPVPVTVAPVEHRAVERTVEVTGTFKGWESVTIGAKKSGRVVQVAHDMGDRVRPGELLVQMNTVDAKLTVRQAERQLQVELSKLGLKEMPGPDFDITKVPSVVEPRVAVERSERNHQRELALYKRGAGTLQAVQDAEADLRAARATLENATLAAQAALANVQAAQVALEIAQQELADMEIQAPVPSASPRGEEVAYAVTKRMVAEGQMLQMGGEVFELVIEDPLRLWVNVPERARAEVELDQPARITVAAYPDRVFEGKVARINPAIDETSRTFQVEIATPNPDGLLRPGGYAKASITTERADDATVVPLESIVEFAGVTKLFVVEDDRARAIPVRKGLEGPDWVEVIGDLPQQAPVVTTGQTKLADGTPVVIRKPAEGKQAPHGDAEGTEKTGAGATEETRIEPGSDGEE